jgi:hypothetical protein
VKIATTQVELDRASEQNARGETIETTSSYREAFKETSMSHSG